MNNLTPITHKNVTVATTQITADFLGTNERRINENFIRNKGKFIEDKHFFKINHDNAKSVVQNYQGTKGVILWTERGCARHSKLLNTAESWDLWESMEDTYFAVKQPPQKELSTMEILKIAMEAEEQKALLKTEVEELKPKAEALDRIATSDGSMCITNTAKDMQMRPKDLFAWLSSHQWIYKRTGGAGWIAYQEKLQQGLLEHKVTVVSRTDGSEKVTEQVRVTAKGLTKLANMVNDKEAA